MIYELVNDCIESEAERGIEKTTLKELRRYLHEFADYCQQNPITVEQISSDFMRRYVQFRGKERGPNLVKAVVWSLRKFGAFLVIRNFSRKPRKAAQAPKNVAPEPIAQISLGTSAKGAATQFGKKAKQEGLCHSRSYLQHRYAAVFSGCIKKRTFFPFRQLYL